MGIPIAGPEQLANGLSIGILERNRLTNVRYIVPNYIDERAGHLFPYDLANIANG
jgi:hypothetical protein